MALHQSRSSIKLGDAALTTWLYRVAFNKSMDRHRTARPERLIDPAPRTQPGPDAALLASERAELLRKAATELPPRPRQVFVLRIGLGLNVDETAALTGIQPGAVRTALHTAKSILQARLGEGHAKTAAS